MGNVVSIHICSPKSSPSRTENRGLVGNFHPKCTLVRSGYLAICESTGENHEGKWARRRVQNLRMLSLRYYLHPHEWLGIFWDFTIRIFVEERVGIDLGGAGSTSDRQPSTQIAWKSSK